MSTLKPSTKLKFKNLSKKAANILSTKLKIETLTTNIHFIGALRSLGKGILKMRHLNYFILLLRRAVGKGRMNWSKIHLTFNIKFHKTEKASGHRMGHGKGNFWEWSHVILPGEVFVKILGFSNKFVFFDAFSWSNVFMFFEYYFEHYVIFFMDSCLRYKWIYTMNVTSKDQFFSFRTFKYLNSIKNYILLSHQSFFNLRGLFHVLYYNFLKFYNYFVPNFSNNKNYSIAFTMQQLCGRSIPDHFPINLILFLLTEIYTLFMTLRYLDNGMRFVLKIPVKKIFVNSFLFKHFLCKFWLTGYFAKSFSHIRIFNLHRLFMYRKKIYQLMQFLHKNFLINLWKNVTFDPSLFTNNGKVKIITNSELCQNLYPEQLFRLSQRKKIHLSLVFRGLRRIQHKLPFRSEIIMPYSFSFFNSLNKKKILKHFDFNARRKKKK